MIKLKSAFYCQKAVAKARNILFLLTFDEWLKIWINSGHLPERGRGKGKYCMARPGDVGPYSVDNVKIILFGDNTREAHVGRVHSEETKKKQSELSKNRRHSEKTKTKMSVSHTGKPKTAEHRENLRQSKLRYLQTEEGKFSIAKMNLARLSKPPILGRKHTEASKEKIRISALGRKHNRSF